MNSDVISQRDPAPLGTVEFAGTSLSNESFPKAALAARYGYSDALAAAYKPAPNTVFCHWAHIPERVPYLLQQIEERIVKSGVSRVKIYLECVGGAEGETRSGELEAATYLINHARPLSCFILGVLHAIAIRLPKDWGEPEGSHDSIVMDIDMAKRLGQIHDRTAAHIDVHTIDIPSAHRANELVRLWDESKNRVDKILKSPVATLKAGTIRRELEQAASEEIVQHAELHWVREQIVRNQLMRLIPAESPDTLHFVVMGSFHSGISRDVEEYPTLTAEQWVHARAQAWIESEYTGAVSIVGVPGIARRMLRFLQAPTG